MIPLLAALSSAHAATAVAVDPEVELLELLFRLAGAREFTEEALESPFTKAADAWFEPHRRHPAVRAARRLRVRAGVGYDAPASLALALDGQRQLLVPLDPRPEGLDGRWHPRPTARWLRQVRDFAEDTGWERFWAEQAPLVARVEAGYRSWLEAEEVFSWFEVSFGPQPEVELVVTPSFFSGRNNFGAHLTMPDGRRVLHPVVGVLIGEDGEPRFGEAALPILVHEIGHAFAGDWVEAEGEAALAAARAVQAHEGRELAQRAYPDADIVADETMTRAFTQLYLRDRHPELVHGDLRHQQEGQHFFWVEAVASALEGHRSGRASRIDLEAAGPDVFAAMTTWAALPDEARVPPFRGPFNAAAESATRVVGPTAGGPVGDYAKDIATRLKAAFGHEVPFEAAPAGGPLPPEPMLLYGTPVSNPSIREVLGARGWEVAADHVQVGLSRFTGEHLVLIACSYSPASSKLGVGLYTAADEADLIGVNSAFHGPDDWRVLRALGGGRFELVAHGDL